MLAWARRSGGVLGEDAIWLGVEVEVEVELGGIMVWSMAGSFLRCGGPGDRSDGHPRLYRLECQGGSLTSGRAVKTWHDTWSNPFYPLRDVAMDDYPNRSVDVHL